jgi:hypothetical protein
MVLEVQVSEKAVSPRYCKFVAIYQSYMVITQIKLYNSSITVFWDFFGCKFGS